MTEWKSNHSDYLDEWISLHYGVRRFRQWTPANDPLFDEEAIIAKEMLDAIDAQVADLNDGIAQIGQFVDDLQKQLNAIEYYMTIAANNLETYLDGTMVFEIEQINGVSAELVIGSTYNDLNNISTATITDWKIIDSTTSQILYQYEGAGWDGDPIITGFTSDWNFGKDYLLHPLSTFDGNYGLYPRISALNNSRNTTQATKTKISNSGPIFEKYL